LYLDGFDFPALALVSLVDKNYVPCHTQTVHTHITAIFFDTSEFSSSCTDDAAAVVAVYILNL
jgi:hypothetical protein